MPQENIKWAAIGVLITILLAGFSSSFILTFTLHNNNKEYIKDLTTANRTLVEKLTTDNREYSEKIRDEKYIEYTKMTQSFHDLSLKINTLDSFVQGLVIE